MLMTLQYILWNPDPILFQFGFYTMRWYSLLFLIGVIISYEWVRRSFQKDHLSMELFEQLSLWVIFGGLLGARLAHCLFYDYAYFSAHPWEIILPFEWEPHFKFVGYRGIASHGGAAGVLIVLGIFLWRKKDDFPLWAILDYLALVIPLTGCFIRLGNLMNSEIIGKASNVPWAFIFERVDQIPRHPTQLYEAIAYLFLFIALNGYVKYYPSSRPGFRFGLFLLALFTIRFILEFFKEHQAEFTTEWLINMGQILSIPFMLTALVIMLLKRSPTAHLKNSSS